MSRQSKNTGRIATARSYSALRKSGGKGPAKTTPKHGKSPLNRIKHGMPQSPRSRGDAEKCAAVEGHTAFVYGPPDRFTQRRPLLWSEQFSHRGSALRYAEDFDALQR